MHILLTGGSGYIGSAVLTRLLAEGHSVGAVVRSEAAAARVRSLGGRPLAHPLTDRDWLVDQLRASDAAIHTASPQDDTSGAFDDAVIDAITRAFSGTGKRYIHTGGVWSYGNNPNLTEQSPIRALPMTAWRASREERVLASPIHATVLSPALVYGGRLGLTELIPRSPRTVDGAWQALGSGEQHWTTVHVADLADLYLAVLERGRSGETYIGASGANPTVRELTQALAGFDGRVIAEGEEETRRRLGQLADALFLDQQATGAKAKAELGWNPDRPSLVEEFARRSPQAERNSISA